MTNTLPCPFCGHQKIGIAIVEDGTDGYTAAPEVFCRHCGATISLEYGIAADLGEEVTKAQKDKLLALWNRRSSIALSQTRDELAKQCEYDAKLEADFAELYRENLRLRKALEEAHNGK